MCVFENSNSAVRSGHGSVHRPIEDSCTPPSSVRVRGTGWRVGVRRVTTLSGALRERRDAAAVESLMAFLHTIPMVAPRRKAAMVSEADHKCRHKTGLRESLSLCTLLRYIAMEIGLGFSAISGE